jgi:nucleoside-diphosphate-sugar epimerase
MQNDDHRLAIPDGEIHYLVTGGGGFLGSAIAGRLVGLGLGVTSFSRSCHGRLDPWGVTQIQGDLADPLAVEKACQGVQAVFHVAAKAGVWGPYPAYHTANVVGTRNVIDACLKQGVRRLIYTSSPSVVFDGRDMQGADESVPYPAAYHAHYPRTKAMAEQMVLGAACQDLATIALRPHLIWGPGDNHLVPRIIARAKRLVRVGDGRNPVDTIYIDNAAEAHLLAEQALRKRPDLSGKVYFISNDEPIALWEMVDRILAAGGLSPVRRSVSARTAWLMGALLEGVYRLFRIKGEPPLTRFVANEMATAHWFDISAAKRDLGYRPIVSLDQGLRRLAQWLQVSAGPQRVSSHPDG